MVRVDNNTDDWWIVVHAQQVCNISVWYWQNVSRQQAAHCVLRRAHCILHVSSDTEQLTDVNTDNLHHIAQHNYSYFSVHIITLYWLTYPSKTRDLKQKLLVTTELFWLKFYLFIKKMTSLLFNCARIHGPKACAKNN